MSKHPDVSVIVQFSVYSAGSFALPNPSCTWIAMRLLALMGPVLCQLTFCLSAVPLVWLSCLSWPAVSCSPFCAASTASSQPSVGSTPLSFLLGEGRRVEA